MPTQGYVDAMLTALEYLAGQGYSATDLSPELVDYYLGVAMLDMNNQDDLLRAGKCVMVILETTSHFPRIPSEALEGALIDVGWRAFVDSGLIASLVAVGFLARLGDAYSLTLAGEKMLTKLRRLYRPSKWIN